MTFRAVHDIAEYPGIRTAHADLSDIRHRLSTHGLPRLRNALDLTSLPVTLEFRFTTKTDTRAI